MVQDKDKVIAQHANATVGINKPAAAWLGNRKPLTIVAIVVVVGVVVGGAALFTGWDKPVPKPKTTTSTQTTGPVQQASYESTPGNYQASEKTLQSQLAGESDTSSKLTTLSQQSATALQFNNYSDAQKYAQQAMQLNPSSPTPYADLALIAQDQHDTTQAKQYWQEAINHITPDMPGYNLTKADYQSDLDALK
jgi:tetratricopeptide (TPR) repeat protein